MTTEATTTQATTAAEGEAGRHAGPAFPLDRSARIAASIDLEPAAAQSILDANQLDGDGWRALWAHWQEELGADASRGTLTRLRASDAAYVARLEEERGPITPDEYAGLIVAAERGTLPTVLAGLGIPAAAHLRIERVWLGKTVADTELARAVKSALRAARAA
jgi:hypothetical protein